MRRYAILLMFLTAWPVAGAAQNAPVLQSQIVSCRGAVGLDINAQSAACNAIINAGRGPDLAEAYSERCALEFSEFLRNSLNKNEAPTLLQAALADCNKSITLSPDHFTPYRTRGEIYDSMQQFDLALAEFTKFIAMQPDSPDGYMLRGNANNDKGDYDAAIADYDKSIAVAGTEANKADFMNGAIASFAQVGLNKAKEAKIHLAAGQKLGDPRAWCDGQALPQEDAIEDKVISGCTKLIESGRETPAALAGDYQKRADAYFTASPHDKAIADYGKVIALKHATSKTYWLRGILYAEDKKDALAVADFTMAIRLDPKSYGNYSYRGQSYIELRKFDAAIADFNRVLELSPANPEALYRRGMAYLGKKNYGQALVDCRMAIQLSQTSEATVGNNVCGNAHLLSGDVKSALDDYAHSLALWPEYPEALYGRGVARLRNGDEAGGRADISAAVKLQADIAVVEAKAGIKP